MLKNKFRMLVGVLVLAVFGLAVVQYFRQTAGSPHIGQAWAGGLRFLLFLALVLYVVSLIDRKVKEREARDKGDKKP